MTLSRNLNRLNLAKRFVFLVIASLTIMSSYAQQDKESEDWWIGITKKHKIKYNSYTLHGDCFIVGEKTLEGELENFKNVIIVSKGSEDYYYIYKSITASYDPKTTTLQIIDCTMEKFKKSSTSLEPEEYDKHINLEVNFEKNIATMSVIRPDYEIENAINSIFEQSLQAGEQLDFEKMNMAVDDKYSSGFINNGNYYKSYESLFADYKNGTNGIKSQKITIDNKKITILSDRSVLLSASGNFSATTVTGNIINGKFAWTIIYKEIESQWKIIHMHMSNIR